MLFRDRPDAGRQLASRLAGYRPRTPLVLALPRGGLPVAFEVARALDAPLDLVVTRKLGAPGQPELAIGAIAEGGVTLLNERIVGLLGVTDDEIARAVAREGVELERRARLYREGRPPPEVRGRVVLLVDDGIATGATARAALRAVRENGPASLVLAVPVCAPDSLAVLTEEADEVVCLAAPEDFYAVGQFYDRFDQTTDAEVIDLLRRSRHAAPAPAVSPPGRAP
jgi:putative phosphoribosyl transferase